LSGEKVGRGRERKSRRVEMTLGRTIPRRQVKQRWLFDDLGVLLIAPPRSDSLVFSRLASRRWIRRAVQASAMMTEWVWTTKKRVRLWQSHGHFGKRV
jgi:hypothetical protein